MQTITGPASVNNSAASTATRPAASATSGKDECMHLCYGLNIGPHWKDIALGPARDLLIGRIREAGTSLVRVFPEPAGRTPAEHWQDCAAFFEAVQKTGAAPMIAYSSPSAWNDRHAVRTFAQQCGEFADRAVAQWGPEEVSSWYWSIGDEPNSPWSNSGLTFEGYRDIYEAAAEAIRQRLPCLDSRPRIGGPCVDGFQIFWFDWIWRFVEEIDPSLIGFVAWNRYGDWREPGTWSGPANPSLFERLLLSRTSEYWSRSEAVGALLKDRGILNVCCELNAHPHPDPAVSGRFNQGVFGAAYYGSALIELMRGGADGEFLWAGIGEHGPCGALDADNRPTPTYEAKKLIAQNVRLGDPISFPLDVDPASELDAVVAWKGTSRNAAVLVHRDGAPQQFDLRRWPELSGFARVTMVCSNGGAPVSSNLHGDLLSFNGYGVALLHQGEVL